MKCFALLTLFFFASIAAAFELPENDVQRHWNLFKSKYNKHYSREEDYYRKEIFVETLSKIIKHNIEADLGLHSWRKGVNKFSDLTPDEFSALYKGYKMGSQKSVYIFENSSNVLPKSVDWRTKGLVNPVKDQGQCGSCWAFSAVASLEGQHAKKTGNLVSLSEQNLVDCSRDEGNEGCDGGLPDNAFEYIKKNNGIDTEKSYPYKARDQKCHFDPNNVGATVTGYVDIKSGSEMALQEATAKIGPISVGIDADDDFQSYQSGVFNDEFCSTEDLDHGVTVVGYGTENGQDYWIVRNSWGEDWGEQGYIRMSRNKDNQCGIATAASYPLV